MAYDALLAYKENKIVKTVVVYSSNIKNAATSLDLGSVNYNFDACYMCDVNGDEIFEKLKIKIKNGDKLTKQDMISFGFLPLMNSKKDRNELAIEAVKVIKEAEQREDVKDTLILMYALFQKFVNKEYLGKMKEAFQMTVLGAMLKEDGKIEGRLEGEKKKAIEIAKELLDILTVETIAKKTGLSVEEVEKLKNEKLK